MRKDNWLISRDEFLTPVDSLLDRFFNEAVPAFGQDFGVEFFGNNSYPKVDVKDYDDKITIEAEIPGLAKDDVSVDLESQVLMISGGKREMKNDEGARYIRKELKRSSFKRSFKLGDNLNVKKIQADFDNGLLLVTVPKREKDEPKKVKIL
jgi:HSP20 family protein